MIKFPDPDIYKHRVTGNKINNLTRRGKYLIMHLDNGVMAIFHLRMTLFEENQDILLLLMNQPITPVEHDILLKRMVLFRKKKFRIA